MCDFSVFVKMEFMDLVRFFEAHGYSHEVASTVADYLTSCIEYQLDLNAYVWNTLPAYVFIFDSKDEATEYLKSNYDEIHWNDCVIYECENGKVYFEGC